MFNVNSNLALQKKRIRTLWLMDCIFTIAIIPAFILWGITPALLCWGISEIYAFRRYVEERDNGNV